MQETIGHSEIVNEDRKCGLGIVNSMKENFDKFSLEEQSLIEKLLTRPQLDTSIVSGSGLFRIHYDINGSNAPRYNSGVSVHQNAIYAAEAIDSAYRFEVEFLGYPQPPADFGEGGDDLYDIYILATGNYGATTPENLINEQQQTYTSYMDVHPEFGSNFYTHGINALQVTMAHELHHAIQVGNYINRISQDLFFYELTSTAMEEFVFDTVNDYYGYFSSYFNSPETPLPRTSGYNSAVWNIFLRDNFGFNILKRQWEMMPLARAMFTINNSLLEYETSFAKAYNTFGIWLFFTNYRAVPGAYFEESNQYPLARITFSLNYSTGLSPVNGNQKPASHNYIRYIIPVVGGSTNDTLVSVISNGDVQNSVNNPNTTFPFEFELFNNSGLGERYLSPDYSSTFSTQNPTVWSVSEILNNIVVRSDTNVNQIPDISDAFIFPNPFSYSVNSHIYISIDAQNGESVDFNVYTSGMELINSSQLFVQGLPINNSFGISWEPRNKSGDKLSSGVYIYVIQMGDNVITGKIVIFN